MRRLIRLTALALGVLLLAAPAAWACCELGATVTPKCQMASKCPPVAEMAGSMETSICHDDGQMAKNCCDARSTPEPTQALPFESAKLLVAFEVTDLRVVASLAPAALPLLSTPADAFRLHDLGRYTLFSSFLL